MAKKKTEEEVQLAEEARLEREKEIKLLLASNKMMEKTKAEAKARGANEKTLKMIDIAQDDVIAQLNRLDENMAKELMENKSSDKVDVTPEEFNVLQREYSNKSVYDMLNEEKENASVQAKLVEETAVNDVDPSAQYDIVSLPSNGEAYKNKTSRIPVGYLTAYDENFITSPNLYRDGLVIDFLLKNKIMNKNVNIDELLKGDVDAIILFLRATSYGTDFPVVANDPETGRQIETVIDLSKLKYKEFKLKGDENGYFDYELPLSKDKIKFKFLTRKEEKLLERLNEIENKGGVSTLIDRMTKEINAALKDDNVLSESERLDIANYISKLGDWGKKASESNMTPYNKTITNRMELEVVSVNGNTDRKYIMNYVRNMRAKDSLMLRRYINDNEPGVDFEVEVERPKEFGGGSFKTFLEWGYDTIFLNIS